MASGHSQPEYQFSDELIDEYETTRILYRSTKPHDLGLNLDFKDIFVLDFTAACRSNKTFLKELIWREFFMQTLWHFHTLNKVSNHSRTVSHGATTKMNLSIGAKENRYPLVDAGMRQLNAKDSCTIEFDVSWEPAARSSIGDGEKPILQKSYWIGEMARMELWVADQG